MFGQTSPQLCLGEFIPCAGSLECVLDLSLCGACTLGQYRCPQVPVAGSTPTCVSSADDYVRCPGLNGTHLDWTAPTEGRLDALVAAMTLDEQIGQLQNAAPPVLRLGIPGYQWLNDDQHGVARTPAYATVFPNGCGIAAGWSTPTVAAIGAAIANEARGLHNGFLHAAPNASAPLLRPVGCNGCGITLYSPNLNIVKDPRWGRAQETFGEDPTLTASLVTAFVRAAQASETKALTVGMCCKHFAAYDLEDRPTARYTFNATVGARDLWETYLPAFKACVVDAAASHVMCSYNQAHVVSGAEWR
jgi:beta-glucosidase